MPREPLTIGRRRAGAHRRVGARPAVAGRDGVRPERRGHRSRAAAIPEHDEIDRDQEEVFLALAGGADARRRRRRPRARPGHLRAARPASRGRTVRNDGDEPARVLIVSAPRDERLRADGLGMRPGANGATELREMIGRYNDAWNAHDVDAILALHAPGMVFENHTAGERAEGEAVARHIAAIFEGWPDLRFDTRRLYVRDGLGRAGVDGAGDAHERLAARRHRGRAVGQAS